MPQRLIPYGNANFEKIITENYYFVDKTNFIAELEKYTCPVFLRPRRFGKSVFTEMLRWYYDIKAKDRFTDLFGNTYIGKNHTAKHNTYFFLKFDFSGMAIWSEKDKDFVKKQFDSNILIKAISFLNYYKQALGINNEFAESFRERHSNSATNTLKEIIQLVHDQQGKLFIAIDEYDSLTNALAIYYQHASTEENEYLNILKKGGFFRSFFEALKEGLTTAIDRVYITGILPITIADMNSGFNVADWVTFEPELLNMLGITQTEFDNLLDEIYQDYKITYPKEQAKEIIKIQYNGYRFSPNSEPVYNPMMTLYFLKDLSRHNKQPDYLYDNNIRVDYRQIEFIFGNNYQARNDVIARMTDKKQIPAPNNLNVFFDMNDYKEGRHIEEGLYYLGLLTFSELPDKFIVPNLVTYDMVIGFFERVNNYHPDSYSINRIIEPYKMEGDVAGFMELFFEKVIKSFPGDFFKNANESFYHGLLYHLLNSTFDKGRFEVYPEFNLPCGTCDLILRSLPGARVQAELKDIFEIKRVPKSAVNAKFETTFNECKQQLAQYKIDQYKDWRGIAVCFRGNKDYKIEIIY